MVSSDIMYTLILGILRTEFVASHLFVDQVAIKLHIILKK